MTYILEHNIIREGLGKLEFTL